MNNINKKKNENLFKGIFFGILFWVMIVLFIIIVKHYILVYKINQKIADLLYLLPQKEL